LNKTTGQVVDFVIGNRTKATLKGLIDNLLASGVKKIRTDKLKIYQRLIPKTLHRCGAYCINHIERKNLSNPDPPQATESSDDLFQPERPDAGMLPEDLLLAIAHKNNGSYPVADDNRQLIKFRQHFFYRLARH
jgi:IS1 transposase